MPKKKQMSTKKSSAKKSAVRPIEQPTIIRQTNARGMNPIEGLEHAAMVARNAANMWPKNNEHALKRGDTDETFIKRAHKYEDGIERLSSKPKPKDKNLFQELAMMAVASDMRILGL
jgi:hypothetical protein